MKYHNCISYFRYPHGGIGITDEELYKRLYSGDSSALRELYERYALKIRIIAKRIVSDSQIVEEIVQDVFTRVWMTKAYDPDSGSFEHWIQVVAKHIAIDYQRRIRKCQCTCTDSIDSVFPPVSLFENSSTELGENQIFLRNELSTSLSHLRSEEQHVLHLAYFEGWTLNEIAIALKIPIGTVKTRLHLGLLRMRSEMSDWSIR